MQPIPENDDAEILSELGLTNNQIKIYLALLKLGTPAKAIRIYQVSGVPRQDVYRVLLELQQIGIVEKIIARPIEYIAVNPKKAVYILIQNKMRDFCGLKDKAEIFSSNAIKRYSNAHPLQDKDKFTLITEKQAIILAIKETVEKTQQTFYCIAPKREFLSCLTILSESLSLIKNEEAQIRWVTEKPDRKELPKIYNILSKNCNIKVKFIPRAVSVKFALSDGKEIVLAIFEEGNFAETPALLTNSPAVISLAKNYFDDCWKKGRLLTLLLKKDCETFI